MHRICFLSHVHGAKESHWDPRVKLQNAQGVSNAAAFELQNKRKQTEWKTWVPSISAFFPFRHSPCLALSILQNWINILCTVFSFSPTADMLLGRLFVPFQILYVFQDRYITSYASKPLIPFYKRAREEPCGLRQADGQTSTPKHREEQRIKSTNSQGAELCLILI